MIDDDYETGATSTGLPQGENDGASEAWSLDDTVAAEPAPKRLWVRLGLVAVVAVFAGMAFVNPAATFFRSTNSKHVAPAAKPSTTSPVNAPAAAPPTRGFSADDQNFLSLMSQEGWGCGENSNAEQCKKQIVGFAHQICSYSGQPIDVIYQNFDLPALLGPGEKRMAIVNAQQSYPNCKFTGSP